jgi:alkyl sulfatase BDS1-like metallo-beta-lactamase superfamily hydrolase
VQGGRGNYAVTAIIYTHSHVDHFGGVLGIVEPNTSVPIYALEHFLDHVAEENVYARPAMLQRGYYHAGITIPKSPTGNVGLGLGPSASTGKIGLLATTRDITHTGQEVIDGVQFQFQLTPGTQAPAEMNFSIPERRALCMAENATHTMHNILTLRSA